MASKLRALVLGLALLAFMSGVAQAQGSFRTTEGSTIQGTVPLCITTSSADVGAGIAVPCGTHGTSTPGNGSADTTFSPQPTGNGVGVLGWLSDIWNELVLIAKALSTTLGITGNVGGFTGLVGPNTPAVTKGAYAAGAEIGPAINLSGLIRSGKSSAMMQDVQVNFLDNQSTASLLLYLFIGTTTTTFADDTAFNPLPADQALMIGPIAVSNCSTFGSSSATACSANQLARSIVLPSGAASVQGVLVAGTTMTLGSAADVSYRFSGPQD